MMWIYLKIAWRMLTRHKMYTVINIVGLSVGISTCLVIFLIINHELSYDKFHSDKDRIYRIVGSSQFKNEPPQARGYIPTPLPFSIRNQVTGFEDVAGFYNYYAKVNIPQTGEKSKEFIPEAEAPSPVIVTEKSYFKIFKHQWLAGDINKALEEPFMVVLTENAGKKYFGNTPVTSMLGRTVVYNDSLQLTVSGIIKDWNHNSDFGFTDFISFPTVEHCFLKNNIDMNSWGVWDYYSQAFVKLAPGVSPASVEAQFPKFVKDHFWGENNHLYLQPLSNIHFDENYEDGYSEKTHLPTLYGLMGIAAFILIIAIINFINLSTAQSLSRMKEIGVKKVLGSDQRALKIQFFGEIFLLAFIAILISIILLMPMLNLFKSFVPVGVILHPFNIRVWLFLFTVLVIITLLAGFYPAKILSAFKPANCLRGQTSSYGNQKNGFRKSLLVFQFTISLVFIIGALVVGKQIHYMLNSDMGFDKDAIISLHLQREKSVTNKLLMVQKLNQLPGIKAICLHAETPLSKRHPGTSIKSIGTNGTGKEIISSFEFADNGYVPLFGIDVLAGRNLKVSDTLNEFLINVSATKQLGFEKPEDAVGKLIEVGIAGKKAPVVGIIKDFHSESFHESIKPFFITSTVNAYRTLSIKLATNGRGISNLKKTLTEIEKKWDQVYPDNEFDVTFFDDSIKSLYEKEKKTSQLVNTAMVMAIIISCMGLVALISFTTQRRKKEIGIRKVLGANASGIIIMIIKDFMLLIIIALLIASPIAYYFINIWLENFAYRVSISWWIFPLAGLAAICITICSISFQSVKAAMANPVKSLRTE